MDKFHNSLWERQKIPSGVLAGSHKKEPRGQSCFATR